MNLPLRSPQAACTATGRAFAPGEIFHSALVRSDEGLARIDVSAEAWAGPPPGAVASWRSRFPDAGATGPTLAPVDVLLDALDELGDAPVDAAVRYLLALHLVRRRVLRIVEAQPVQPRDPGLVVACRRRDREYRVEPTAAEVAASAEVAERLSTLLWSGEAA
jgi:hypothetical protein